LEVRKGDEGRSKFCGEARRRKTIKETHLNLDIRLRALLGLNNSLVNLLLGSLVDGLKLGLVGNSPLQAKESRHDRQFVPESVCQVVLHTMPTLSLLPRLPCMLEGKFDELASRELKSCLKPGHAVRNQRLRHK
jgi:hypothetical protein